MTASSLTAGFQLPPRLVVGCSDATAAVARTSQSANTPNNIQHPASQHVATPSFSNGTASAANSSSTRSPGTASSNNSAASKKGQPWSETEHLAFISGLKKLGKGNWRGISRYYVQTRTPTQVASHAQKHFMRLNGITKRKSRFSILEQAAVSQVGLADKTPAAPPASQPPAAHPAAPVPTTATATTSAARSAPTMPQWSAHPHPASYPSPMLRGLQHGAHLMPIYPAGIFAGQPITFLPTPFAMMDGRLLTPMTNQPARGLPAMTIPMTPPLASKPQAMMLPIQPAMQPSAEPTTAAKSQPLQLPPPIQFTVCRPTACHAAIKQPKTSNLVAAAKSLVVKPEQGGSPWAGKPSLGSAFQLPKATAC